MGKAAAMGKATKAMKAMKAMRQPMKAKRVSVIAKVKRAKSAVFAGRKEKTVGGLRKDALRKNSKGKIVSKKASARAQKASAAGRGFRKWAEARKTLGLTGFVPVGGKTASGKALYAKAKALL